MVFGLHPSNVVWAQGYLNRDKDAMLQEVRRTRISIPPKLSVSEFMGYLKGKSTLMLYDRHPELVQKGMRRNFWARGYYVSTVGNVNEETVRAYIKDQEETDKLEDSR